MLEFRAATRGIGNQTQQDLSGNEIEDGYKSAILPVRTQKRNKFLQFLIEIASDQRLNQELVPQIVVGETANNDRI